MKKYINKKSSKPAPAAERGVTDQQTEPSRIDPGTSDVLQRKCAGCEEEEKVQRKPMESFLQKKENEHGPVVHESVSEQINTSRGSGQTMDSDTLAFMQSKFGADFNNVTIHSDGEAATLNRELNAKAFTAGNDIYFDEGQYQPATVAGKYLLAHELTHVLQQNQSATPAIQRATYGGRNIGVPADWDKQVAAAITSADKLKLIKAALGGSVKVHDRTTANANDIKPNPDHLETYSTSEPNVNFIDNLETKESRTSKNKLSQNVGYTFFHDKKTYIILGGKDLIRPGNYYGILQTLNHEFDHVRQQVAGSKLTGNSSELDAWVSSFAREFHRSYGVTETGGNCRIDPTPQNSPLLGYYIASGITTSEKKAAVSAISSYYNTVLAKHSIHLQAFKVWILRSLKRKTGDTKLAEDLNTALSLGITIDQKDSTYANFPCKDIANLSFSAPSLDQPTSNP